MEGNTVAKIALQAATYAIDKPYDYQVPPELLDTLRRIATDTVDGMSARKRRDDGDVCRTVRSAVSSYLYKTTKRSPMIIPMVTKL